MKQWMFAAGLAVVLTACGGSSGQKMAEGENPFFAEQFETPFGVPPFDQIKFEHYKPAMLKGMELGRAEIDRIVNNPEAPTFENTIAALDGQGKMLSRVRKVFGGQNSVNTTDDMQALSREMSPLFSKYSDDISLNPKLFARVKAVYEQREKLGLDKERMKLLVETYKDFERGGANLSEADQAKLRDLNSKISMLQLTFGQNLLKETNAYKLVIEKKEDLAGLPETVINNAASKAKALGMEGKWVFTLQKPSVMPFLQYSEKRELREQIFKAYINRANNDNENDNKEVVRELVKARLAKAKLLGYDDYAAFQLENRMAKTSERVYGLLDEVWKPSLAKAKEELADINAEIKKEGGNFKAEGWDWSYYFNKAKKSKFNLDENELRPYLKLDNVREGAFYVANRLYGITFTPIKDIALPFEEAQAFECKDKDGTHLGVIYFDFFPRASKRGGAWCGTYRSQSYKDGKRVAPVVTIVTNFSQPAPGKPALLRPEEANTLFHEFGHGLHNLFKDVHYSGVSSVPRDFVELPSQVMEHWAFEPEVLRVYAKHYETGEVMPAELIEKLDKSGKYGQGFVTTEYLAASYLDMDFHAIAGSAADKKVISFVDQTNKVPADLDVMRFEDQTLGRRGLLDQIPSRYRATYFNHTMGGGYTAGYYSYIWAEVLDCDAFEAFKGSGDIFNQEFAAKFRKYVLTPGGIDDAMDMYKNFRGHEPSTEPLLKNRGLD